MSKFIELNGETYKRIDDLEEEKPSLKPEEGDYFYCIVSDGKVVNDKWRDGSVDEGAYKIGNIYQTKKEAEQKLAELKAIQRVKEYIVENFGYHPEKWLETKVLKEEEFIADSDKYYYLFWVEEGYINTNYSLIDVIMYSPIGYLKTEEQAEQLIEDKKEDLETIYKPK